MCTWGRSLYCLDTWTLRFRVYRAVRFYGINSNNSNNSNNANKRINSNNSNNSNDSNDSSNSHKLCLGLVGLLQLVRCIGLLRRIRFTGFKARRFFRRGMVQRYANRRSDPRKSKECTQCNSFERGHFRFGTTRSGIPSVVLKCYNVKEFSKVKPKGSMYLYSRYLSLKGVPI